MHLISQLFSQRFIFEHVSNLSLLSQTLISSELACGKAWKQSRITVPNRGLEQHSVKNTSVHRFKPC